jgi:hypothetical protein
MKSFVFWDITPCNPVKSADVSEEYVASIFRMEVYAKQEINSGRYIPEERANLS